MFYFFPGTKKNVCFKVGAKKKNCVLILQKKNITESNNLDPPPPEIKWCVPNVLSFNELIFIAQILGNNKEVKGTPWDETFSMLSILKI